MSHLDPENHHGAVESEASHDWHNEREPTWKRWPHGILEEAPSRAEAAIDMSEDGL